MTHICVFCASSNQIHNKYFDEAAQLAHLMGKNKMNLIHGGGQVGLMGHISKIIKSYGNRVTGVIPTKLNIPGVVSEIDDEIIITPTMAERKERMRREADAFISLPGGFGTLEETLEVITLKQLEYHNKAILIFNAHHYFDGLLEQLDQCFKQDFVKTNHQDLYFVAHTAQECIDYLNNYKAKNRESKY